MGNSVSIRTHVKTKNRQQSMQVYDIISYIVFTLSSKYLHNK